MSESVHWLRELLTDYRDVLAGIVPVALLAALGGVVRSMQCGKTGLKAVAIAAISAGFAGVTVNWLLAETGLPVGVRAALVGLSGYSSGELLKILSARLCKWAGAYTPGKPGR